MSVTCCPSLIKHVCHLYFPVYPQGGSTLSRVTASCHAPSRGDSEGENVACHCSHNDEGHTITGSGCVVETWTFIFSVRIREKLNFNHPTIVYSILGLSQ